MVKVAIIDSEKERLELEYDCIGRAMYVKGEVEIFPFANGEEVVQEINQGMEFDVLISDIKLPGIDGLELGKFVRRKIPGCYLVYLTSLPEFAVDSYRLEAYQYILKREMEERLPPVMERLVEKIKKERNYFMMLGSGNKKQKVYFRDILYVQKDKERKYVTYMTKTGNFRERGMLKDAMEKLGGSMFLLADRSYIVNMKYIEKLSGNILYLEGGFKLAITRTRLRDVREKLNGYWKYG